jgi:hypothetical protein
MVNRPSIRVVEQAHGVVYDCRNTQILFRYGGTALDPILLFCGRPIVVDRAERFGSWDNAVERRAWVRRYVAGRPVGA